MSRATTILVLIFAAACEAGEDALVRVGLQINVLWQRTALFSLAAVILFAYG